MFLLGFILFCSAPTLLGYIWLHIFHVTRGSVGFYLINKLPTSHDVVARIQIPDTRDGSHYSLDMVSTQVRGSVSQIFLEYTINLKHPLMLYGVLTGVCTIIDCIEFLIQFIRFGYRGSEHSTLAMLALTCIFLCIDFFYILWAFQAKQKFPNASISNISRALFGFVESINGEIKQISNNKVFRGVIHRGSTLMKSIKGGNKRSVPAAADEHVREP